MSEQERLTQHAADLVEADLLYKAAPKLIEALRLVQNHVEPFSSQEFAGGFCEDPAKWIETLLAALPRAQHAAALIRKMDREARK